jgi:glycosyltransferase involved in cell wall biosynthesis
LLSTNLIMFGEDWGAHPSSTQHLARQLASDRKILWVNSIGLRRPRLNRHDLSRLGRKLVGAIRNANRPAAREPPPPSLTVAAPLTLPFPSSTLAQRFNRELLASQLRHALTRAGIKRPILWTSLPSAVCVVGALGEQAVVYYCCDDFGSLAGVDHDAVLAMERELVARADLIIAASEALAARFPPERTLLVPHGVDFERFSTPAPRAPDEPEGRPIAGYYGSLSDWIDVDLMAKAAGDLPDWWFVLIGPVQTDISVLSAHQNVRLLGPRPHDQLPSHVQHWTVAVIPFRDTPQIRASNPLKLREYLASGTPIAATPFPALAPFINLVAVAKDRTNFSQAIRSAAADRARAPARRAAVADQSWQERARIVSDALEKL